MKVACHYLLFCGLAQVLSSYSLFVVNIGIKIIYLVSLLSAGLSHTVIILIFFRISFENILLNFCCKIIYLVF